MAALKASLLALCVLLAVAEGEVANKDVVVTRVARELDLTSHLVKQLVRKRTIVTRRTLACSTNKRT